MNRDYIDAIIKSAQHVILTMCSVSPVCEPALSCECDKIVSELIGIIKLENQEYKGELRLKFDQSCILDLASRILIDKQKHINQDVIDVAGELTNIITGAAKSELENLGIKLEMDRPFVINCRDINSYKTIDSSFIAIPFSTPAGRFVVETSLKMREKIS